MRYPFPKPFPISTPFSAQHLAYDFATPVGTAIYAIEGFNIDFYGIDETGARSICGEGETGRWAYGHVSKVIALGGWANEGQLIGETGGWPPVTSWQNGIKVTEKTSGPHCHIQVHKGGKYIDWMKLLEGSMSELDDVKKWLRQAGDLARQAAKDIGQNIDVMPDLQAVQWVCDRLREGTGDFVEAGKLYRRK
jgi:murein DD-endopeptidase MepM/ murein hydrolase activator NlpD